MTPRAVEVLQKVSLIIAEDTRHSGPLLKHFGISTPVRAYHDHSAPREVEFFLRRLRRGDCLALIADAGTPLVSDPGYRLLDVVLEEGLTVRTVPGPSALSAALGVAGIPVDRFVFEGFLPARAAARRRRLEELAGERRSLVFFEAPHRLLACVADLAQIFGDRRRVPLLHELSKLHESVRRRSLGALRETLEQNPELQRGENVLLVAGAPATAAREAEAHRALDILLEQLPPSRAATLASRISGAPRAALYKRALARNKD